MSCRSCLQSYLSNIIKLENLLITQQEWDNLRQTLSHWKAIYIGRWNNPPELFKTSNFKAEIPVTAIWAGYTVSLDSFKNTASMDARNF